MLGRVGLAALGAVWVSISVGAAQADEIKVGGTGAAHGILQRLGEAFMATHPGDTVVAVPGLGSSGGISAVAEGALQVSFSGRSLKPDEQAKGVGSAPVLDTPFLFVTSHSKPQNLSKANVVAIYDGRLGTWPDGKLIKPILRPKSDSVSSFLITHFEGMQGAMDKLRQRADVPVAATDHDSMEAAEKLMNSLAGATLVQFLTESPRLRPITLDGVEASVETMENGTYSLITRLHAVIKLDATPGARRFVAFLRTPEAGKIIRDSGGLMVPAQNAVSQ